MVNFNRRHFLQGAAGALGAIGLSQFGLERRAVRYGQALAQSTPRKVALLVGINDYPARERLFGPVTDVELQKQLLIHRFGFNPSDVHTLTNQQATRQGILEAFDEYLIKQVNPGDVVVFHYSGHGGQVQEYERMRSQLDAANRDCIDASCQNTTIVPIDYSSRGEAVVDDIMGHTLLLLRSLVPSENLTMVLDCCYAGGGKRGNVVMRSRQTDLTVTRDNAPPISRLEDEYQQQLLSRLGWSIEQYVEAINSPVSNGFVVTSSRASQQSADYAFDGFTAGAFTYLLTQHLWQDSQPLSVTIPTVASSTTSLSRHGQIPEYDPQGIPRVAETPVYHLSPVSPPAEAILLDAAGNKANGAVQLWLGGLDPISLESFNSNAEFTQIDQAGNALGTIKLLGRHGLIATGEWVERPNSRGGATPSPLLQERVRGIPAVITLRVGLDDTLSEAEKATAQALLQGFSAIEWTGVDGQSTNPPHVLLGRYTTAIDDRMRLSGVSRLPTIDSVGLFSATQEPLLLNSFSEPGETVAAALGLRLKAPLTSLLIGRMLALMVNQNASQLKVSLALEHGSSRSGTATRGGSDDAILVPRQTAQGIEIIPVGDEVTIRVANNEPTDLHIGLLVIDAAGEVTVLFPPASDDASADIVRAGRSLSLPRLRAAPPYGITQLLVMASSQPLQSALRTLRRIAPQVRGSASEASAEEVMRDMFGALDSRRGSTDSSLPAGPRLIDASTVAVLSLLFDVVSAT
ncbi:caspase family protein [Nodosilinea sp. PGN35]|uniref:caspase family protein n=1 Tax=Nodosilinea sp. PGN35 TaxID=3020489 RepID=UPI0023B2937B|nr:caspase family protein [Nodosilinea sp. TSF1-S3]MDF0366243.1 caspase family protein [Nodosilinea sp. TSF1-S3]